MKPMKKRGRGRPKKEDVKKYPHMFRLNETNSKRLLKMYEVSKARSMSQFLTDKILNHKLQVIEINKSAIDFVMLLSQFFAQMRGIKNNYNQVHTTLVKQVGEEKAQQMLKIIEQSTLEFIKLWKVLEGITQKLRTKWLPK